LLESEGEEEEEEELYEPRSLEEAVHTLQQRIIKRFNIEQRLILNTSKGTRNTHLSFFVFFFLMLFC
jgi:hypothetical protein